MPTCLSAPLPGQPAEDEHVDDPARDGNGEVPF